MTIQSRPFLFPLSTTVPCHIFIILFLVLYDDDDYYHDYTVGVGKFSVDRKMSQQQLNALTGCARRNLLRGRCIYGST